MDAKKIMEISPLQLEVEDEIAKFVAAFSPTQTRLSNAGYAGDLFMLKFEVGYLGTS